MRGWTDIDVLLTTLLERGLLTAGALAKARELSPTPLGLLIVRGDVEGGTVIALAGELGLEIDVGAQIAAIPPEVAMGAGFEPSPAPDPPVEIERPADPTSNAATLRPFAEIDQLLPLTLQHLASGTLALGEAAIVGDTELGWCARYPVRSGELDGLGLTASVRDGGLRLLLREGGGRADGDLLSSAGLLTFEGTARRAVDGTVRLRVSARLHGDGATEGLWLGVGELVESRVRLDLYVLD